MLKLDYFLLIHYEFELISNETDYANIVLAKEC